MPGVDTGIYLTPGEAAVITATGRATCHVGSPGCRLDANGDGPATGISPYFFDENAPAYSLVGEVGRGPLTFIGTGPTTVQGLGELRLGYNDQFGAYGDNGGGFTVTIRTTCPIYRVPLPLPVPGPFPRPFPRPIPIPFPGPRICPLLRPVVG
jgi:hypothetical protein